MFCIPTGVLVHWNGSENEIFAVGVDMPVVQNLVSAPNALVAAACCDAGLDFIVVSKAVGSKVLEVLGICHESAFHIDHLCLINSV